MPSFVQAYVPHTYALMRIVTGFTFLLHGARKLLSVPVPPPPEVPSFWIAVAGPIELVGGTLVMIGLFAGWAGFLCSGFMAYAYWMALTQALFMGELAALYCFVFLYISAQGSGIWSMDAVRKAS